MHVELLNLTKIEPKIKDQLAQLHNDLDSEMKQYDNTITIDHNSDLIDIWKQNNAKIVDDDKKARIYRFPLLKILRPLSLF